MRQSRRIAAFVLAAAMVFSALPMNALAAETQEAALGPCEHHPEHTADCGYAQAVPESPCTHTHSESCYTLVTQCVHTHDEGCAPAAVTDEAAAPAEEPAGCAHQCSEESGCVTKTLACTHQHDDQCGYAPGVAEQPCTFSCTVCNAQKQEEPAVPECICETPCTAEAVNQDCPVCGVENGDLTQCQGTPAQEEPVCTCTEACTAEAVNQECPVCGVENGDLTQCQGTPAQEEPSCTCTEACTAEAVNQDCPVCGAENADLTQCKGKAPDEQVKVAQALVDALPTVEKLEAMTAEEQQAVYEKLQAAHAAYQELTEEQKAKITGAEKLDSLLAFFAGKTNALINGVTYLDENGSEQTADNVTEVASGMTAWSDGWYVVNSDVTIRSRVTVSGDVHLILADGASLTAKGGINVAENNSFSVYAQSVGGTMGTLTATGLYCEAGIGGGKNGSGGTITINGGGVTAAGGENGAGIGGGNEGSGGAVTINGGTVTAVGGNESAGIGGGMSGSGDNITINGGTVNANGGDNAAGIGGGFNSSGGNITIHGGSVTATGGWRGAGIGGGNIGSGGAVTIDGGTVTATGGEDAAGIGGGMSGSDGSFATEADGDALIVANGGISDKGSQSSWSGIIFEGDNGGVYKDQTLSGNLEVPSNKTLTVPENTTLTVPQGVTLTNNGTIINNGTIQNDGTIINNGTIQNNGVIRNNGTIGGNPIDGNQPIGPVPYLTCDANGQNWTTETCTNYTVVEPGTTAWSDGWYVVNGAVTIDSRVTVSGEVHLILADGASLTVNGGIGVEVGNRFTVYAQSSGADMGTLIAQNAPSLCAGIGASKSNGNAGNITIHGGTITSTGENGGAGIGGAGEGGDSGQITINGGIVTATGKNGGSGIGGGISYSGKPGNCTGVTINGGTVTATGAPSVVGGGAGIGGGGQGGNVTGTITISGGIVTATAPYSQAGSGVGIGGGSGGSSGTFSTGTDGNALIIANRGIGDKSQQGSWSGIIFDGDNGKVYKDQTLHGDLQITGNQTLTVPEGSTLTVPQNVTLTCDTTLTNDGTIAGHGTLDGTGNLVGSGTVADTITNNLQRASAVTVTVTPSPAVYGSQVTITANISKAVNTYALAENQVEFFVGTDGNQKSLGTVNVSNNEAYLTIALSEENGFVIGENTITAEYGGSMGLKPESGTATLTIKRITPNPTTPTGLAAVYGQTLADVSLPSGWAWDAPETSVGNVGENTFPAIYTQDNSGHYNEVKQNLTVKVTPAAYQITLTGQPDSPIQITLNEAEVEPGNTGTRVTYGCSTTNAAPDSWQAERVFSGLTADTTYYFFAKAEATQNHAETISQGMAITTPKKSMSKLEISHQPTDLSYTSGQALDLSGLSVKVSYNDNTSEIILWGSGKLTADPAQGTVLRVAKHHRKAITVSYGGKTAETKALTVDKAAQADLTITGAPDKIYKGSSFTLETSGGSGEGAVTWQVVKGSATVDEKGTVTVSGIGEFQIQAVKAADAEYEQAQVMITLTAVNKPGSGGSDSQNKGDSTTSNRPDKDAPNTPTTSQTPPVKPETNGNANIGSSTVQQAIDKATANAKKNGSTANGIAVVVPVDMGGTPKDVQIILKAETLDKLVSSKVKRFTIDTDCMTDFGFEQDILKELNRQTSGDIVFKVKKTVPSSDEAKAAIGTRPVYDISLWEVKDGKETQLTDLNGKAISIAIPYTPAEDEQPGRLYAVSVDAAGKVQWITKSSCDGDQKAVIFLLTQPGIYAVGYDAQVPAFTDITGHWAKDNILFAVSRGLLDGTSETTFIPDSGMTRGMFVTALGRLAGVDPSDYPTGKFTDVKADADYAPYVNWAASKGIMAGTGATTFAPDSQITREQMAVILKNYAAKLGCTLPKTLEAVTFADNASISSEARETVKSLQQAGILAGKTNNRFDPAATATRAEVATVLRRFVEIVIDPQTANGWVQNDSGQWSYCQNGKRLSDGWKQIDGKQYYFYPDGSMAVNTTVDGYQVGTDGARTN